MLSAIVLRHRLPRESHVCISTSWGNKALGEAFVQHAALDVFAVWNIHSTIGTMGTPQPVSSLTPGGTPVMMFAPDGREIARGVIALDRPATFHGINVEPIQ